MVVKPHLAHLPHPSGSVRASAPGPAPGGFTLIELLIVIALLGVLIGILLPALRAAQSAGRVAEQRSAAKQLALAYQMFADDHRSYVLPAQIDFGKSPAPLRRAPTDLEGRAISGPAAQRWVWHLAPYVQNAMRVMYRDKERIRRLYETRDYYQISLYPGFGINERYVGGLTAYYTADGSPSLYQKVWGTGWWVRKATDAHAPSTLMTFVSSGYESLGERIPGFFRVTAPRFNKPMWRTEDEPSDVAAASDTGQVAPVAGGVCVAAMLDGHAESLSWPQILDMRRWSPIADATDWTLEALE